MNPVGDDIFSPKLDYVACTQVGVALFKDHPNALYPFSAMDARQRAYVEEIVISCMNRSSQIVQRTSAQCAPLHNVSVHMQMGGGCVLYCTDHDPTSIRYNTTASAAAAMPAAAAVPSSPLPSAGHAAWLSSAPEWTLPKDQRKQWQDESGAGRCMVLGPKEVLEAMCNCIFASSRCERAFIFPASILSQ